MCVVLCVWTAGANFIEDEFGRKIDLSRMTKQQRLGIAKVLDTCKPHTSTPDGEREELEFLVLILK